MTRRFPIKIARWARPILLLYGATADKSYVEVSEETVLARMGWYKVEVPRSEIEWVRRERWPWWRGIGIRGSLRGSVSALGAFGPVVRIHLRHPRLTVLSILPTQMRDLYVGPEDADGLIAALA